VNIAFQWNQTLVTTQNVPVTGTYGYFVASRQYTDGDIHETNLSFFAQDAWSINNKLTVNYGVRLEKEEIPSYNPNAPGRELRVGRQDRAPCRLRLRHQGRRQVEGVRIVRPVLRHHEARDAARRVGRRKVDQLLLHARHLRLEVD
jgi:outer membrane receptor protein involved in Fe transport